MPKAHGITAKISVNTVDARSSVNQLKRSIRQMNRDWKNTYNAQIAAGNSTKALKTKQDGLKRQSDDLKYSINQLNQAMDRSASGTKNYHAAELDLEKLQNWYDRVNASLKHTNSLMTLHNDTLHNSIETQRHDLELGQQRLQQYRDEGNETKANIQLNKNRAEQIRDLDNLTAHYQNTINQAKDQNLTTGSNKSDYDRVVEGLHRTKQARAELSREIAMDDSHLEDLTHTEQTEREINQSTIRQYQAEHNSVAANNTLLKDRVDKLKQLKSIQTETEDAEGKAVIKGYGNSEYVNNLTKKMNRLDAAVAQTKSELTDLRRGLTAGQRYNDYYNQSVRKVISSLKAQKSNMEANRAEYGYLTNNIHNEHTALRKEQQYLREVAEANRTTADSTGHLSVAYQKERSKMESMNKTYSVHNYRLKHLAESYGKLSLSGARAMDNLSSKMRDQNRSAHRWLLTSHSLQTSALGLGMGFLYGAKKATTLEHEFNKIGVLAKNSGESVNEVNRNVRSMGNEAVSLSEKYGVSQSKISDGFENLIRRGYSSSQALHSMQYYLKAATASGEDLGDVINTAGSTIEGFDLRNQHLGKNTKVVTNEMAAAADYTASSFHDMGYAMSYTGSIAHGTGQSISQTASALGILSNNSIKGSMAGTSLRRILGNLASFKSNNKILKGMGLGPKDFQTSHGGLKNISDIMSVLQSKMKGMSKTKQTSIMTSLFGRNAENAARVLTNNADAIGNLNTKVSKAAKNGYTSKTSQQNMKTTEGELLRLRSNATQLAKEYAEGLMPIFSKTADGAMVLGKALSHLPTPVKDVVAGATAAIPILWGVATVLAAIHKATSVYLGLKRKGIKYFTESDSHLQTNAKYFSQHKAEVDNDTTAISRHNDAVARSIKLAQESKGEISQNSTSLQSDTSNTQGNTNAKNANNRANNDNAASEKADAAATDEDSGAQKTNTEAGRVKDTTGAVSGTAGKEATSGLSLGSKVLRHTSIKTSLASGALIGGTEALSGQPKQGAEDGLGTTAGMMGGGALGAALGSIVPGIGTGIGSTAGSTIGMMVGPSIGKAVGNSVPKITKAINPPSRQQGTSSSVGRSKNNLANRYASNAEKNVNRNDNMIGLEGNHPAGDSGVNRMSSFDKSLAHMSRSAASFIKAQSSLQGRALQDQIRGGKSANSRIAKDYKAMYALAKGYSNKRLSRSKSDLKLLLKNHDITRKEYNDDLKAKKTESKNNLAQVRKDEKQVEKDRKNHSKRLASDSRKLNKDLLKISGKGSAKQQSLLKHLVNRSTKLTNGGYAKVMNEAKKNYENTKDNAQKTLDTQKKHNDQVYKNAKKAAGDQLGVGTKQYNDALSNAKNHKKDMNNNAQDQYNGIVSKARKQKRQVVDAADKQASQSVQSYYGAITKMKQFVDDAVIHPGKGAHNLAKWGREGFDAIKNHLANGTPDTQTLHLAVGNLPGIDRQERAVVNDGDGRELIHLPNGQLVLPNGRNVHTVLPKGTSVFNAGQTRKLLGPQRQAVHFASGTVGDIPTGKDKKNTINVKTPSGSLKRTEKSTKKSMSNIHDLIQKGYKKTGKDAGKLLDKMHDKSGDVWDDTRDSTKDHIKDIHDDTIKRSKDLKNSLDSTQTNSNRLTNDHLRTMVTYFRHHFSMIPPISRTSMSSGISNINSGIGAIDKVLSQFGGNSHVLGAVHYATGTSGPSMRKQLAVLNDATSGPQQEAIVSDQGRVRIPRGRNVPTMLNPGDKVLNGSDTLRALKTGLIPHYAGGLKSSDALRDLAKNYAKTPTSFTNNTFNKLASVVGNVLSKGITQTSKTGAQEPANKWSSAMWQYIDSLIDPDNSVLVKKMHELGDGKKYKWDATGPSAYDCSGLVHSALSALGIGSPRTSGPLTDAFQSISRDEAGPGDLVGNSKHIGVVDSEGAKSYFSAFSPGAHPNILSQPLDSSHFTPGTPYHFARVPQLAKNNEEQRVKSNPLTSLVKRQLGHAASGWIYQNLGDAGMSNPAGDGVGRWRKAVVRALQKNRFEASQSQIDSWLQVISRETGGDPKAVNNGDSNARAGHPSKGLVQTIEPTFKSNAFPGHSDIFNGYDDLLSGIHYAASRYGRGSGMFSRVASTGYANGGLSDRSKLATISEGNRPEMVLPLTNKSRAVELMLKSLQYMFGNEQKSQGSNSHQESNTDHQFERELIQSNKQKDFEINKLVNTTNNILNKMTILINTVRNKPVLSQGDIHRANRDETLKKARLRNFNRGTF